MPSAPVPGMSTDWEDSSPFFPAEPDLPSVLEETAMEAKKMTKSQNIELLRESGFYEAATDHLTTSEVNCLVKE